MSQIVPYQHAEIASILNEALAVTPQEYHPQVQQSFQYLALCFVQTRDEQHLADIQAMIDAAKLDDRILLEKMRRDLMSEISRLRTETAIGFSRVGDAMSAMEERLSHLESKVRDDNQLGSTWDATPPFAKTPDYSAALPATYEPAPIVLFNPMPLYVEPQPYTYEPEPPKIPSFTEEHHHHYYQSAPALPGIIQAWGIFITIICILTAVTNALFVPDQIPALSTVQQLQRGMK